MIDVLYTNAAIHGGQAETSANATAFGVTAGKIVFLGSAESAPNVAESQIVDLGGRSVLPGFIDSHAHPGLVALIGELESEIPGLPVDTKANFFAALQSYAELLKDEPFIVLGDWEVAMFLPEGPHRSELDAIFPDKPAILTDNSGHSTWMNSAALALFGVDETTPDLSPNVSVFVRDDSGDPTGWVKEFSLIREIGQTLLRPADEIQQRLALYLNYLNAHGVTTLWDAGNFDNDDEIYSVLAAMDSAGLLPVRYEASYHIFDPAQLEGALQRLLTLRKTYSGDRLKFNTIKVHYDGVVEVGTAGMLEPYNVGQDNRGGFLFTAADLADFIVQLNNNDIDLHLHSVGDAATREILDAVALVRDRGIARTSEVTISHLEHVNANDYPRFAELDVHANFTPHWWGGTYFGESGEVYVGKARIENSQQGRALFDQGANVTFSSDVTTLAAMQRANPFVGIQMAMTRQEYDQPADSAVFGSVDARVTLAQAIAAYTHNGARQLGQQDLIGAIELGKAADFMVLPRKLSETDTYEIRYVQPDAVVLDGKLVSGKF